MHPIWIFLTGTAIGADSAPLTSTEWRKVFDGTSERDSSKRVAWTVNGAYGLPLDSEILARMELLRPKGRFGLEPALAQAEARAFADLRPEFDGLTCSAVSPWFRCSGDGSQDIALLDTRVSILGVGVHRTEAMDVAVLAIREISPTRCTELWEYRVLQVRPPKPQAPVLRPNPAPAVAWRGLIERSMWEDHLYLERVKGVALCAPADRP